MTLRLARPDELDRLAAIDDAAGGLYAEAGLPIALAADHPFVLADLARWRVALERGAVWVAVDGADEPVGFAALGVVDGAPYLDELAVHPDHMRRGWGRALVARAVEIAAGAPLWLTTYDCGPSAASGFGPQFP